MPKNFIFNNSQITKLSSNIFERFKKRRCFEPFKKLFNEQSSPTKARAAIKKTKLPQQSENI